MNNNRHSKGSPKGGQFRPSDEGRTRQGQVADLVGSAEWSRGEGPAVTETEGSNWFEHGQYIQPEIAEPTAEELAEWEGRFAPQNAKERRRRAVSSTGPDGPRTTWQ